MSDSRPSAPQRVRLTPDLEISRLVTGLWQVADMERRGGELDPQAAARAMDPYLDAGLTSFDMADHYGSAERIVGARRRRGDRLEALTKWVPAPGPVSREDVRTAVERALARLEAERLDLLQFHAWSYSDPRYLDCLFWLQELVEEGLVGALGVTNFDTAHLRLLLESGVAVVSNQVCVSLLDRRALAGMAELCARRGVALLAYGTLAGGLLTGRYRGAEPPAGELTWSLMKYQRFLEVAGGWRKLQALLDVVERLARRLGVSMGNVACRWVLEQPGVAAVIVGARLGLREHVAENLRLFDFALDAPARAELDAAAAELEPIPGDCGDEYRKPPYLTASGDLSDHFESFPPAYTARGDEDGRRTLSSGTTWEKVAGYSRAVRDGDRVYVAGTTAAHGDRRIGGDDAAAQTHFVLDKIAASLEALGARLEDVVRTRVFVSSVDHWEAVARVHGERFATIRPANTLVEARLVGAGYLVEIEADAVVRERR